MIVQAAPGAPPNFFLVGYRAPPGQLGTNAEQVGAVVLRQVIDFAGAPADGGEVLKEDKPFAGQPDAGPFRYEAEIAAWKPQPDVVVVDDLATFLTPAQIAAPNLAATVEGAAFGTLAIDRGAGFGPAAPQNFGWLRRTEGPRVALAGRVGAPGDPSSLAGFKAEQFHLPDQYDNAFQNGRPVAGALFKAGDRLRFTDAAGPVNTLEIPAAPPLKLTKGGQPLNPPATLAPQVDTVVMDRGATTFTVIWRATFPWAPALEDATLEVG
jgi:hypothetical protein